jgi:hypothetical protein
VEAVSRGNEHGRGHGRERSGEAATSLGSGRAVEWMDLICGAHMLVAREREGGLVEDNLE